MKRFLSLFVFFMLGSFAVFAQEIDYQVNLRNGGVLLGSVTHNNDGTVTVRTKENDVFVFRQREVKNIKVISETGDVVFSRSYTRIEFRPHWSIGVQGGAAYTLGEAVFGMLISPAVALNFQWQFHHAFGLRLGLGGWQGKGAIVIPEEFIYPFRFAQLNADILLDLTSLIGGFNHKRICSTYLFAGVGAAYGFDNKTVAPYKEELLNYWDSKFFVPGRVGLGVDFRLSDVVTLGVDANTNFYSDKFNSKYEEKSPRDWQFNLLAGLKFNLGKNINQ